MSQTLSHLDEDGHARMVDVTVKEPSLREAMATGRILMSPRTLALIQEGGMPKGDVFGVARVAGIMAAKKTGELIPMCHPLELTHVDIQFDIRPETSEVLIEGKAKLVGRTGVEMEALTGVSIGLLTIYDMVKAIDKGMVISNVQLEHKSGGKTGDFQRN